VELPDAAVPANCVLDNDAPNWKEVVDLEDIFRRTDRPDWAYYAAADPDGTVRWFRNSPTLSSSTNTWFSSGLSAICQGVVCLQPRSKSRGYLPDLSTDLFFEEGVPAWAEYAARNKEGRAYLYSMHPTLGSDGWESTGGRCVPYHEGDEFRSENWENSIITRPLRFEVGDWIYNHLDKQYEQVFELKGITVRTVKYFKGQRKHSDWHVEQIKGYFDPDPIKVKPWPEWDAHKLVGKVVRDSKGNAELVTAWNVDQQKVYMDYHAVKLEDLTKWWLDDRPCGVIESKDSYDEDN
jgi:hypothetical protein